MLHRLRCCALALVVMLNYGMCQNVDAPAAGTATHPLSEPGDPPGLAELLKRAPRNVERPLITGRRAMVTSLEPLASMAGMRVLQQGGNAFDAAVATAVAVTVLDPRMSSIGGNGFPTIYVAKTHEVRALNFYGSFPQRATIDVYKGKDYSHGFLSVPVPSCLKGYEALHKAYGRLPRSQVLQPAIELAGNGFFLTQELGDFIHVYQEEFAKFPSTSRVFLPNGRALRSGDNFRQPDLARTGIMVALTQTLGDYFGSQLVAADTGVLLSDEMRHLHLDPNEWSTSTNRNMWHRLRTRQGDR